MRLHFVTHTRPSVWLALSIAITGLTLSGCAPDISDTDFYSRHPKGADPVEEFVTLGEAVIGGVSLKILSPEALHVGPNTVLVEAVRSGTPLTSGSVGTSAIWIGEGRALHPPYGFSTASSANDQDRFELLIHLLQPVDEEGQWVLDIDVDFEGAAGQNRLEVAVEPDMWVQYVSGVDATDSYYVSWIEPVRPETGEAAFEIAIHRLRGDEFIPVTNALLDLYPYMDMGAGEGHSTPYEPPIHTGSGLYRGSVNYIMAGGWSMTVLVDRPGRKDVVVFNGITVY